MNVGRGFARVGTTFLLLLSATAANPATARADEVAADKCIDAAEQSQPLRHQGKLMAAREKLVQCSRAECPSVVRGDCTRWLSDLQSVVPSIVLAATDSAGSDVVDVRVSVDGEVVATRLDGKEIEIDPGVHTFRFEHDGSAPIEEQVVIRETQRHRVVSASFATPASTQPATAPASTPRESPDRFRRSLVWPIALMGAGVAAVGTASYFWLSGLADRSGMASGCALTHSCAESAIDSARNKLVAGDVIAGAGVAAALVGAGLLVFGRAGESPTSTGAAAGVQPVAGGAVLRLAGPF